MTKNLSCDWRYSTGIEPFTGIWIWGPMQRRSVTLAAREHLLNAEVPSTASRFASSSAPGHNDRGKKSLGAFSLSMWLQFHIKWQVSSGGRDWKAGPQRFSVCFVAGDFYASWGPSWFCFHWSRFLPPGFLSQNNGFLLSSSEFTTITQNAETKQNKTKNLVWQD